MNLGPLALGPGHPCRKKRIPTEKDKIRRREYYIANKDALLAKQKARASAWTDEQRKQRAEYQRRYKERHPERLRQANRANWVKRKYGAFDYDAACVRQGGVCAICASPERQCHQSGTPMRLTIDHHHATGVIRGLLCHKCNKALGLLMDDSAILRRAATYLEAYHADD